MEIIRQGDILLRKVSKEKSGVFEEVKDKILARGEVTGHNHRIEGKGSRVLRSTSGQLLVELQEPARFVSLDEVKQAIKFLDEKLLSVRTQNHVAMQPRSDNENSWN